MRRVQLESGLVVLAVLLLIVGPTAVHGWPTTWRGNLFVVLLAVGSLSLAWWRREPRIASVLPLTLFLASAAVGEGWFPDTALVFYAAAFAVLATGWSGRAAWLVAAMGLSYVVLFAVIARTDSWVGALMFTMPPFVAGTVLRLRQETADQLAARAGELEEERDLYTQLALRHERARIASELHDIVGHAISVMVIQAAAGQRLVGADPSRAGEAFTAICESARQGTRDLQRLLKLLSETDPSRGDAEPGLSLVDDMVERASRTGLNVACRFEGDRRRVPAPVAHLAYRVVQESLTNAMRYAPGAGVRIAVLVEAESCMLTVRVENDPTDQHPSAWGGSGRGLIGLRERVQSLGGELSVGATRCGGWSVEARLPAERC